MLLISQRYNFIFIHIPKAAGTSVARALEPFATSSFRLKMDHIQKKLLYYSKGRFPVKKPNPWVTPSGYPAHIGAPELISNIGRDVFKSYYSFAIVRNPWSREVSRYNFVLKTTWHPSHQQFKDFGSFDNFIKFCCTSGETRFRSQKDFIYSEDGELLVNFVGRFERLERDFDFISAQIGIHTSLPKLNISTTKPYQDYYNAETKELVRRHFEPDIRLFDYDFE